MKTNAYLIVAIGSALASALVTAQAESVGAAGDTLTATDTRICVTGYDHNRPDPFPGLGDFIGWAEAIERMPNGDILLVHSAGCGTVRKDKGHYR